MPQGVVKWFDTRKGFGFIAASDESGDIFVHFTAITGEGFRRLREGDAVEYDVVDSEKGPQAQNVRPVSPEASG